MPIKVIKNLPAITKLAQAVSYTHLDVYKRQDRGHLVDDFSVSESENQIEINGINSELTIVKLSE